MGNHFQTLNEAIEQFWGPDVPDEITPLDLAWEQINALGGVPANAIEEAQNETIGQCLAIIEHLGGADPAARRFQLEKQQVRP